MNHHYAMMARSCGHSQTHQQNVVQRTFGFVYHYNPLWLVKYVNLIVPLVTKFIRDRYTALFHVASIPHGQYKYNPRQRSSPSRFHYHCHRSQSNPCLAIHHSSVRTRWHPDGRTHTVRASVCCMLAGTVCGGRSPECPQWQYPQDVSGKCQLLWMYLKCKGSPNEAIDIFSHTTKKSTWIHEQQ